MSPVKFNKTYVDKNVILSIEPGVVLEGNKLEIDGTLMLVGKAHDSITIRIKHLQPNNKIVAKYCKFERTGLDIRGFEDGSGVFENCVFSDGGFDNSCKTLTCEDNLFVNTGVYSRNGMATYKDNTFKSSAFSIKEYGSAMIDHNQFVNTHYKTIDIDAGRIEDAVITIKNNHFELDSIFNRNNNGSNDKIAIYTEFSTTSQRTIRIENNSIKNYEKAFALKVDYRGEDTEKIKYLAITGNKVENCNTLLSVNSDGGRSMSFFLVKNNHFSNFKMAFIGLDSPTKTDKKSFVPYRIHKNKYDIPLADLLKRIDDFGNDYEKWVWFEVEY